MGYDTGTGYTGGWAGTGSGHWPPGWTGTTGVYAKWLKMSDV